MRTRRAFTLIELLVVIAIIAILAAILFPVFAQAKESAKKSGDLSNQKQLSLAFQQYLVDSDDMYPLGFGVRTNNAWAWNFNQYVPADFTNGTGDSSGPDRLRSSPSAWANTIQPYTKNYGIYEGPGLPNVSDGGVSTAQVLPGKTRANVGYTYNGLLMAYGASGVVTPSKLPLLFSGRGKANVIGGALSNPALICNEVGLPCTYVPYKNGCASSRNGEQSAMFLLLGTAWVYTKGSNFAMCDGSAKFRLLGAQISPQNTDPARDPYTNYNARGFPASYWWDNCHAWLFRPDIEWY